MHAKWGGLIARGKSYAGQQTAFPVC